METRKLGKTGHQSSVVTFGAYAAGVLTQDEADRLIDSALANGINHIDVAPSYADAEVRLGDYLKRNPQPERLHQLQNGEAGQSLGSRGTAADHRSPRSRQARSVPTPRGLHS